MSLCVVSPTMGLTKPGTNIGKRRGLTVTWGWTNSDKGWDQQWQRVGLTVTKGGTNIDKGWDQQ